jgi:hypothetical protein
MTRERVERVYGRATKIKRSRQWFPRTTRYAGELLDRRWYRVGNGTIGVWYHRGRVKVVETTSSRYRLPGRVHAGSRIAIRRCGGPTTVCWRGFGVDDCTGLLIDWGRPITSYVAFAHSGLPRAGRFRITRIGFGYNDVLLLCF